MLSAVTSASASAAEWTHMPQAEEWTLQHPDASSPAAAAPPPLVPPPSSFDAPPVSHHVDGGMSPRVKEEEIAEEEEEEEEEEGEVEGEKPERKGQGITLRYTEIVGSGGGFDRTRIEEDAAGGGRDRTGRRENGNGKDFRDRRRRRSDADYSRRYDHRDTRRGRGGENYYDSYHGNWGDEEGEEEEERDNGHFARGRAERERDYPYRNGVRYGNNNDSNNSGHGNNARSQQWNGRKTDSERSFERDGRQQWDDRRGGVSKSKWDAVPQRQQRQQQQQFHGRGEESQRIVVASNGAFANGNSNSRNGGIVHHRDLSSSSSSSLDSTSPPTIGLSPLDPDSAERSSGRRSSVTLKRIPLPEEPKLDPAKKRLKYADYKNGLSQSGTEETMQMQMQQADGDVSASTSSLSASSPGATPNLSRQRYESLMAKGTELKHQADRLRNDDEELTGKLYFEALLFYCEAVHHKLSGVKGVQKFAEITLHKTFRTQQNSPEAQLRVAFCAELNAALLYHMFLAEQKSFQRCKKLLGEALLSAGSRGDVPSSSSSPTSLPSPAQSIVVSSQQLSRSDNSPRSPQPNGSLTSQSSLSGQGKEVTVSSSLVRSVIDLLDVSQGFMDAWRKGEEKLSSNGIFIKVKQRMSLPSVSWYSPLPDIVRYIKLVTGMSLEASRSD